MTIDKSHHILIVDDYRQMRLAIQGILFELGFRNIHQANNGSEAQRVMQKQPIAAVISDWNMPGMSGFQLLEWTRQDEHYRKVPFMLLTAETDRNQIRAAMTAGVTEYMVKPFTVNTFTTKFWAMFDTRRSRPVPPRRRPPRRSPHPPPRCRGRPPASCRRCPRAR
ncbi:response regulator [Chitinimonas koreensis]|uniref:response regulator n=1 Tax=Chitinimonas koreensis TaxID=356302 RepID=UPI0016549453|nr:response regulator [Chitinimonas koreensis]QNM98765.1 response regulator [Chitinimonas koreensis]